LTELLKKYAFLWTDSATTTFVVLKHAITSSPILAIPNFKEPFVLETDASGSGVGAVLSQDNHLVAYFSKKLSLRRQNQSTYM